MPWTNLVLELWPNQNKGFFKQQYLTNQLSYELYKWMCGQSCHDMLKVMHNVKSV